MKCPECGLGGSKVIDSRPTDNKIRRRRECLGCKCRFTTYEVIEYIPLMIIKKNGSLEPFDRQKLIERILRATIKRPITLNIIEGMVDGIEAELKNNFQREVTSGKIGDLILTRLKDIDSVAYIRFASVYREFTDSESFMKIICELSRENEKTENAKGGASD